MVSPTDGTLSRSTRPRGRLDALARPAVVVGGRVRSPFRLCGYVGLAAAVALGGGLTVHRGMSLGVLGILTLTSTVTFLVLAMAAKIVVGDERLVYYHHQVAILAAATSMLWATRQPVLAYLDVTLLGVGTFLAFGRVGCFMVGCCHGRPYHRGVCYGEGHADAGFPRYLVGVRLFPIQLVEAVWVLAVVGAGAVRMVQGSPPGEALGSYLVAYAVGRFVIEFFRGDPGRPHLAGFSEAQWTSLLSAYAVVAAGVADVIPQADAHVPAMVGLTLATVVVAGRRHWTSNARHRLLHPAHVQEIAWALDLLPGLAGSRAHTALPATYVNAVRTSAGLRLSSCDTTPNVGDRSGHYVVSSTDGPMPVADARAVADLLARLEHWDRPIDLRPVGPGVFHVAP